MYERLKKFKVEFDYGVGHPADFGPVLALSERALDGLLSPRFPVVRRIVQEIPRVQATLYSDHWLVVTRGRDGGKDWVDAALAPAKCDKPEYRAAQTISKNREDFYYGKLLIGQFYTGGSNRSTEERACMAHVIRSANTAPDLVAALLPILAWMDREGYAKELRDQAHAAINKATE